MVLYLGSLYNFQGAVSASLHLPIKACAPGLCTILSHAKFQQLLSKVGWSCLLPDSSVLHIDIHCDILRPDSQEEGVLCSVCLLRHGGFRLSHRSGPGEGVWHSLHAGVLSGVTSSLFVALNGIYTKRALDMEEMDSVKLTLHINVNASFLLLFPSVLTGQVSNILEMGRLADPTFWVATLLSGFLGFLIAWASARQIDFTSPITHHISNNTKSIIQSLLAVWVFSDYKTGLWWAGCVVVLLGAFSYALVRMREERMSSEKVVLAVQSERSSIV
ncbi:SLC35C1 [Bugula neritina]|uniref:SLC35C1 n=1 Tax=Bugula neritina TaxID=10212 RepID=A0A7J7JV87_BUGNE|nr:SLC35C1 [Bugula neritina]